MTNHIYLTSDDCTHPSEQDAYCNVCNGLSICKVCGLAEGELTTHCPGTKLLHVGYPELVYKGELDYYHGAWIGDKNPANRLWDRSRIMKHYRHNSLQIVR